MFPPQLIGVPGPQGFQGAAGPRGASTIRLAGWGRLDTDQTLVGDDSYNFPVLLAVPFTIEKPGSLVLLSGVFNGYTDPAPLPGVGLVELSIVIDGTDPFTEGVNGGSFIYFDGTANQIHGVNSDFQANLTGIAPGVHVCNICWLYYNDPGNSGFLRCQPVSGPFVNQCTLQVLEILP